MKVSAVRIVGTLATSAPTPAATTSMNMRCPSSIPATAGARPWSRNPAEIVYAQSAPGVMANENETTQKAANNWISTFRHSFQDHLILKRKNITFDLKNASY